MLNEFRSTLITWDKATSRIYSPVTANESDENGRKLVVQVVNGGQVEDLTGATLHLYWETMDKLHDGLDVFKAADLKKGEFELSYTTGMLSNKGALNANLVLIDTVGRVVSELFKITVTEGIDNDAIQSENSFSSLTQALIQINKYQSDIDRIKQDLVDESNQLIATEKAELDALQLDYSERAETLEQNYAPRLNDLTAQLQQTDAKIDMLNNTASLAENGWFKDEKTGFIIQWGSVSLSSNGASVSNGLTYKTNAVQLPIAFPTKIVSVTANPSDVSGREISLSTDLSSSTLSSFPLTMSLLANSFGTNVYKVTYIAMGY